MAIKSSFYEENKLIYDLLNQLKLWHLLYVYRISNFVGAHTLSLLLFVCTNFSEFSDGSLKC